MIAIENLPHERETVGELLHTRSILARYLKLGEGVVVCYDMDSIESFPSGHRLVYIRFTEASDDEEKIPLWAI